MMKLKRWVALALLGGSVSAFGQGQAEDGAASDLQRYRFTATTNAVHLSVSVVDKKGRLVTDLERKDFRVLENDRDQEITHFSRDEKSPIDVILLVDASGSMDVTEKTANARNSAIQLIHGLSDEDRVSVYAFDKDLYQLSDFTVSKEASIEALTKLEPFGSTALYDAVVTLSSRVVHEGFGRRAIVVVTDGVDTSSAASIQQAVNKAATVDLPVYAIRVVSPVDDPGSDLFLGVHGASFRGQDALKRFALDTGGVMCEGSRRSQLVAASARIREELKTQYRIVYTPKIESEGGGFRRILVQTRRRGIEARTRRGYFPKKRSSLDLTRPASTFTTK